MKNIVNLSEAANLAIHALAYMAAIGPETPLPASRIAAEINVSESHLAKVLQNLARRNFIASTRGARGGFYLEKKPQEITLMDIVVAVDGPLPQNACLLGKPICPGAKCRFGNLMKRVMETVEQELKGLTLSDFTVEDK